MIPWPDFTAVPTAVIRADLSPLALRLLLALAKHTNAARIAWPKHETLLRLLPPGTSESALIRAKRELVTKGWLDSKRRGGKGSPGHKSCEYTLMMPPSESDLTIPSGDETVRSDLTKRSGVSARNRQVEKELTSRTNQEELKQPTPDGAGEQAQAVRQDGLLPGVAVAVEALEVPTGSAARPAGPAPAAPDRAAPGAPTPLFPAAARGPVPRDLMFSFGEAYAARFRVPHPKMGGQEAVLAKRLLEQYGLPKCLEFVNAFFTLQDPWLEQTGKGFSIFASKNTITKLIALPSAVSVGRPASISEKWAGQKPGLVAL